MHNNGSERRERKGLIKSGIRIPMEKVEKVLRVLLLVTVSMLCPYVLNFVRDKNLMYEFYIETYYIDKLYKKFLYFISLFYSKYIGL